MPIELAAMADEHYLDYRRDAIFHAYKWDPQVGDRNTVSRHVLTIGREEALQLAEWAEQLSRETIQMEQALLGRPDLAAKLGLPRKVRRPLPLLRGYDASRHVRLMRFDFHPTLDGWAVSEVNSDVPGGLAEASVLPRIAQRHFPGFEPMQHVGDRLLEAFRAKAGGKPIAFVHATSYADDRQVMRFLSDHFRAGGLDTLLAGPDHIRWDGGNAHSIALGQAGELGGIVRFFPLEWLARLPRGTDWQGYYRARTPCCNHPVALFAQSKRLPLVWDALGLDLPAWRRLLPETRDPRGAKPGGGWIYKPALGRVGEGISIRGAVPDKEYRAIARAARRHPGGWVQQRQFESRPLVDADGAPQHLCLGVFTVEGKFAGFYGRISPHPRIDERAEDIPLLVRAGV